MTKICSPLRSLQNHLLSCMVLNSPVNHVCRQVFKTFSIVLPLLISEELQRVLLSPANPNFCLIKADVWTCIMLLRLQLSRRQTAVSYTSATVKATSPSRYTKALDEARQKGTRHSVLIHVSLISRLRLPSHCHSVMWKGSQPLPRQSSSFLLTMRVSQAS